MDDLRLFYTLSEVGYTACRHPRIGVNVQGDVDRPLSWCKDCGATSDGSELVGGSIHYSREVVNA